MKNDHNRHESTKLAWPLQVIVALGALVVTMLMFDIPGIRSWLIN